jgi:hypothetical protein
MNEKQTQLNQLLQLIDDFDTFGNQSRKMSLFSVAIGTLRKDRSIAADILNLTTKDSDGLGALALCRIIIEDYLHLLFLDSDHNQLDERLDNFNVHPNIENYSSIQAMKARGFDFGDPKAAEFVIEQATAGFTQHKDKFQRRKHVKEPFDPDDYYRTWTKLSLDDLITQSGIPDDPAGKMSLKFMVETYGAASTIIHHDAFIIWFLASQGIEILHDSYPDLALTITFISLSRTINLVIKISRDADDNIAKHHSEEARLVDIMESFAT